MSDGSAWALSRDFPAGSILFEEGDPGSRMYVIRSGKIRIYRRVGTQEIVLAFLGPGDFFGEMAILERLPRSANAEVIENSALIEVDATTFDTMIRSNAEIALRIMRRLAARVRDLDQRFGQLVLDSMLGRAIEVLRWLLPQGTQESHYTRVPDGLSHIDLPAQAGIPKHQADALMMQLVRARLVKVDGNDLLVAGRDTLDQFNAYLALKQRYDPPTPSLPSEVDDSAQPKADVALKKRVTAPQMSPKDFERWQEALSDQYNRYIELKRRFRTAQGTD